MLLFIKSIFACQILSTFVSIHLMLLFIQLTRYSNLKGITFQYISCYSLSAIAKLKADIYKCFNTSHVTLYQKEEG